MRARSSACLVLAALTATALGLYLYYLPRLPDRLATHFGNNGRPNGWMDRDTFRWFYWIMVLGVPIFFAGITALIRVLPPSLVNIPNREYWLAPERRRETLHRMVDLMSLLSAGTMAFLLLLFHATVRCVSERRDHPRGRYRLSPPGGPGHGQSGHNYNQPPACGRARGRD